MPRPLRPEVAGGLYHVTTFGAEGRRLFSGDEDCSQFLRLIEQGVSTYGIEIHGFVLLNDSYCLLIQTQTTNLKQFMQRLHIGYSTWANERFPAGGPVFGERFRVILVEPGAALARLSRHFHLAPIRDYLVDSEKLTSAKMRFFDEEAIQLRLRKLRGFRWSSYPAYAGYTKPPEWLYRETVLRAVAAVTGDRDMQWEEIYRRYVEQAARIGLEEDILRSVRKRTFLGSDRFVAQMKGAMDVNREATAARVKIDWDRIVKAVESVRGRRWEEFAEEYGDPGRDLVFYAARKLGGYTLRELGEKIGGMGVTAVGQAVTRLEHRLGNDSTLRHQFTIVQKQILGKN